jgi:hypothetical protein
LAYETNKGRVQNGVVLDFHSIHLTFSKVIMKKIFISGLVAGIALLIFSILGIYITIWFLPGIAIQYFESAFETQSSRVMIFYIHPFIMSFALSWFWSRFKGMLTGSFLTRGIEFGLIYMTIAIFPMMWLIYSCMCVSISLVITWLIFGLLQGIVSGLVFEKTNP